MNHKMITIISACLMVSFLAAGQTPPEKKPQALAVQPATSWRRPWPSVWAMIFT